MKRHLGMTSPTAWAVAAAAALTASGAWAQQQPWQNAAPNQQAPSQQGANQPYGSTPQYGTAQQYGATQQNGETQPYGANPYPSQAVPGQLGQQPPIQGPNNGQPQPSNNGQYPPSNFGQPQTPSQTQPPQPLDYGPSQQGNAAAPTNKRGISMRPDMSRMPFLPAPKAFDKPPFAPLSAAQQDDLDRVLKAWEAKSDWIKTFESPFTRYEYDSVWASMSDPEYKRTGVLRPKSTDTGLLKFKKPDKGLFRVDGERPEMWLSDGKSVFVWDFEKKERHEYPLPPDMQGQAIEDGPLPFLFDSSAEKLKSRFWVRAVQPPANARDQAWLEAYPRRQRDAADFRRADLILNTRTMLPVALQLHHPNGKSRTSYVFEEKRIIVNEPNLLRFLQGDPFSANAQTPRGSQWKAFLDTEQAARMWGSQSDSRR